MVTLPQEHDSFASALFEESLLKMFVILVLRACIHAEQHRAQGSRKHLMMDELFVYIRTHITEEITLEQLEQAFYISRFHIAREFKRQTGQTLHSYIVKTKLDLCCHYIEQGRPITEVYRLGGFGGYNHFFRAFKQEYGMTPKQYFRSVQRMRMRRNTASCPSLCEPPSFRRDIKLGYAFLSFSSRLKKHLTWSQL